MPILNYTTQIDADKTVAELQQLFGKAGCQKVLEYHAQAGTDIVDFLTQRLAAQ